MAKLTFEQQCDYQEQIEAKYAKLEAGDLSFSEMSTIQDEIDDLYTLLGEDGTEPEPATLFDRLLAGEFNNLPTSSQYMDKLWEVNGEADTPKGADFTAEIAEKVAGVIAAYYDTHRSEIHNPAGLNITQQDIDEAA
jgi:hypothetical protein